MLCPITQRSNVLFSDTEVDGKLFINMRILAGILFHYFYITFPRDTETIVLSYPKPSWIHVDLILKLMQFNPFHDMLINRYR